MDQDHGQTSLLLYNFLQCSSNNPFQKELKELDSELAVFVSKSDCSEQEYELQTDGNRCYFDMSREEILDSERQEVIQRIAAHLAQIGDTISIQPSLVDNLIQQLRNINLPAEDKKRYLAAAMEQMMQTIPLDLEQEKAQLLLTMLLAKKVMTHAPSLFRSIFYITVDYINQNLITYIRNLVRNDMD